MNECYNKERRAKTNNHFNLTTLAVTLFAGTTEQKARQLNALQVK